MHPSPLTIIFAGTPLIAADHLNQLIASASEKSWQLAGVISSPDRPSGRGLKLHCSEVVQLCRTRLPDCPLFQPQSLRDVDLHAQLTDLRPDLILVVAYGALFPPEILSLPRLGCINVHASLLPRWRGASPIQRAIAAGDQTTGISYMQMDNGLDTGAVLMQRSCPISNTETGGSLEHRLSRLGCDMLPEVLDKIHCGNLPGVAQDESRSSYAPAIRSEETIVRWKEQDATLLSRMARAFWPRYSLRIDVQGRIPGGLIKLHECSAVSKNAGQTSPAPGTILAWDHSKLLISCRTGKLNIQSLQLPGKPHPVSVAELFNGRPRLFSKGLQLP